MYQRTTEIRAERIATDGIIEGTLATNGEASDGHIIDLAGMRLTDGAPLLFNHDATSGRSNLGSWVSFTTMGTGRSVMAELGDQQLHGVAQIEMSGKGEQLDFRQDVAHMVESGHIKSFSVRWNPGSVDPVGRRSLPKDHAAHSQADSAGLYFPSSTLLEGSVVTIGADSAAVMRHLASAPNRKQWYQAIGIDELERMVEWFEDEQASRLRFDRVDRFFAELDAFEKQTVPGDAQPEGVRVDSPATVDVVQVDVADTYPGAEASTRILGERIDAYGERLPKRYEELVKRFTG